MTDLMRRQGYRKQGKAVRGLLRHYMEKMTGRSRRGHRDAEWAGYEEDSGARMGDLQTRRVPEVGDGFGGAHFCAGVDATASAG